MKQIWVSIAILFIILVPRTAHANGGPLFYPADGYGLLRLDELSNVSLVREKVMFDMSQDERHFNDGATVSIQYVLKNRNDFPKPVDVLFLTPSKGRLTVTEGSANVATAPAPDTLPANWYAKLKRTLIEPVSGKELPLFKGSYRAVPAYDDPAGNRFSLVFAPGETKQIRISYADSGGMYDRGVIHKVFSHLYYLSPAEFWQGDPHVELEIRLPRSGSRLYSNLPMETTGPASYRAAFDRLPDSEWYFSYTYPSRLLFPTNMEKDHNLMVLGTAALISVLAAWAAFRLRNPSVFLAGTVGMILFTAYYITKMGGYPFNDLFVGLTDLGVGAILIVCYLKIRRTIRRSPNTEETGRGRPHLR